MSTISTSTRQHATTSLADDLTRMRILVVDDFATMRRIVRGLLKEIGYAHVDEAEDGVEALDKLRGHAYDFVVADINMPRLDGFGMLEAIKSDPELKHLPVLMVTAEARKEDILRAAQGGAADYIVKPFTRTTLQDKLGSILQRVGQKVSS